MSEKGGVQGLVEGNTGIRWGPRQPVVVSRAWNRVDVRMELMMVEAASGAVMRGGGYCRTRRTVHMVVGGGGASVAREGPAGKVPLRTPARMPRAVQMSPVGRAVGAGFRRMTAGGCFRCGLVGHWKNECPTMGGVDNRSCFTCGRRGHVSRDCAQRVVATETPTGVAKGKDRAEHGPAERHMGPNEKRWLETKNPFGGDDGVRKTMEEIESMVGPSGAHS